MNFNPIRCIIAAFSVSLGVAGNAQEKPVNIDRQSMTGSWYASGLYSINIANNGYTYSRIGVSGGYLGNWGGYAKIDFALNGDRTPNISAGLTKRIATFHSRKLSTPSTLHFYFGLGYGNVEHANEYPEHDHIYHPDGSSECLPDTERIIKYWDRTAGMIAETGLIYRYRHLNFTLGYSITPDVFGGLYASGNSANHSIQLGVGYTFR